MSSRRNSRKVEVLTTEGSLSDAPLSWSKPRYVIVNSMSDLFHSEMPEPEMPEEVLRKPFRVMNGADEHAYQLLTKRGGRLAEFGSSLPWADHIWTGVLAGHAKIYNADGDRSTDRIDDHRRFSPSL